MAKSKKKKLTTFYNPFKYYLIYEIQNTRDKLTTKNYIEPWNKGCILVCINLLIFNNFFKHQTLFSLNFSVRHSSARFKIAAGCQLSPAFSQC